MEVLRGNRSRIETPCIAVLGFFDGVHLGHRALLDAAIRRKEQTGLAVTVHTFESLPKAQGALLTTLEQKLQLFAELGADYTVLDHFTAAYAALDPADFFRRVLLERLAAKELVCGFHYHFGAKGAGNVTLLQALCDQAGLRLSVVQPVCLEGDLVSSTAIRGLLSAGRPEQAQAMLGRPFTLEGRVVHGKGLGRTLGFATLNFVPDGNLASLKAGVYLTRTAFSGQEPMWSVTNYGTRPTVGGGQVLVESHVLNRQVDGYGKEAQVSFLRYLRPEIRFETKENLRIQVDRDRQHAQELIEKYYK